MKQSGEKYLKKGRSIDKPNFYEVGKITFIVAASYREDTDKTVHEAMLDMMLSDEQKTK